MSIRRAATNDVRLVYSRRKTSARDIAVFLVSRECPSSGRENVEFIETASSGFPIPRVSGFSDAAEMDEDRMTVWQKTEK